MRPEDAEAKLMSSVHAPGLIRDINYAIILPFVLVLCITTWYLPSINNSIITYMFIPTDKHILIGVVMVKSIIPNH